MVWICLLLVFASLAISGPLAATLVRASKRFGWVDLASREAHKGPDRGVPNTGGIAVFAAVVLPLSAALVAVWLLSPSWWQQWLPPLAEHLPGLRRTSPLGVGLLAAMALLHLVGLVDDRRALGPFVKLTVQLVVAAALVVLCDLRVLHLLDGFGGWGRASSIILSVAWIVAIVNAFNFLDNMDGLAAGVAATIAALYLAAALIGGQWFVAALAALLLGALIGFGVFNLPPARLFLGDGGSLVVGLLLAVVSVRTTYFKGSLVDPDYPGHWYGVLMPLMVMAIPLYDLVSVTAIRLVRGRSPFRGDHNHFSHRLVRKGLSPRRAVVLIWLLTLATGVSGVMLGSLEQWQALLAAGQTATILAVLAVTERGSTA